jgi:hypothetical protein
MTKEQFLIKWPYLNEIRDTINPYFIEDIDAVIAYEIEKAKVKPAPNPITEAYERGEKIRFKDWHTSSWITKHSYTHSIDESGTVYKNDSIHFNFDEQPSEWELYTEAEAEQVTEPAKPKFDQDRFEAMFRAVVASGLNARYEDDLEYTKEALTKLDAYYATKKGGNNE